MVDYECLDNFDTLKDHKTQDILINDNKLFVAKGRRGIEVYSLNSTDQPVANSLSMTRDSGYFIPSISLEFGHNLLFSVHEKTLTVLQPSSSEKVILTRIDTETFNENINFIHIDKYLPYLYIGLENKGLFIYSTKDLSIKYDYTNSIKSAKSGFGTIDSLYLISGENNGTLDIYRKTFIGDSLRLNKVSTKTNLQDIKIVNIINNKISYINENNNSVGVYDISLDDDTITHLFSIEHNDSVLPKKLRSINDFYYDGFYKIISSDYGLIIIDDDNNTFEDLTFYSHKIDVYDDFIISTDDVKENTSASIDIMGRSTKNSSGVRIYKFSDIFVSKNYGKAPLEVSFRARSLNLKKVSWKFNSIELPSYEKISTYRYDLHGDYNVSSTITYNSGKVIKEYIPIKVIEDKKININVSTNSLSGNAPFEFEAKLDDVNLELFKNISWNILDGNTSLLSNRKVTFLNYTFMHSGDYIVNVQAEDFDGYVVEKNISVTVKTYFQPEIVLDLNRTYMSKDINFSLIYKDSLSDMNGTSKRDITSYKWIFHDGSMAYQKDVIFNYAKAGKYQISAILKDEYNITYEVNRTIDISSAIFPNIIVAKTVAESPYTALFSLVLENNYKRYINDSTWELPNGSTSKVSSISYTFNNEGEFKVKNRYALSDGLSGISDIDIKIDNTVNASISSSIDYGFAPLKVDFSIQGIANSGIKSYDVEFGDGNMTTFDFNETSFSYEFKKANLYEVKVKAHSNKNHYGTASKKIYAIDVNLDYEILEQDLDKIAQSKELPVKLTASITNKEFVKSFQWFYGYESDKSDINVSNTTYIYKFEKSYKVHFEIILENDQIIRKEITIDYPTNKSNMDLYKGWNLISNPLSLPLEKDCASTSRCIDMDKLGNPSVVWILKDNQWVKNPIGIESKYGIWVKVDTDNGLSFYGNRFTLDIDNIAVGVWHLLGNGNDLVADDLSSFRALYIYDAKTQKYIKSPAIIKAGKGFYGIK